MGVVPKVVDLGLRTTEEIANLKQNKKLIVLLPIGCLEPHGPHLPLRTDSTISEIVAAEAAEQLTNQNVAAFVAPTIPFGVTECASAFAGAVSTSAGALIGYLTSVIQGFVSGGFDHVCLINNHLEPGHDKIVRMAAKMFTQASVASPLTKKWARMLSKEFKSGACHAGRYETSIVLAADESQVLPLAKDLRDVPVSLSEKLQGGVSDFKKMGLEQAYSGAPAKATVDHGKEQIAILTAMVCETVQQAIKNETVDVVGPEIKAEDVYQSPNVLAPYYSKFAVDQQLRLTAHSHQAWPDCGFLGQQQAWLDAANMVDDKWGRAFAKAERVRHGFAGLLDDSTGYYALGSNTHELIMRFLSALPIRKRPKLITTDGEYHSIRRQLDRLEEEGIEIVRIASEQPEQVVEKIISAIDDRTTAVLVSAVLFQTAYIVPYLDQLSAAVEKVGAELLVDVYHALNVIPFTVSEHKLENAFIVGGGYKYCQLGEGNCFLRFPKDTKLRPVITGWYSEFSALSEKPDVGNVVYGTGADLFAGATYDPTSHYRAAAVFDFFDDMKLSPQLLREISQHQVGLLATCFDELNLPEATIQRRRDIKLENIAGFLTLKSPKAAEISKALTAEKIYTDYRGNYLRFGPAPYHSDEQLRQAMQVLKSIDYINIKY